MSHQPAVHPKSLPLARLRLHSVGTPVTRRPRATGPGAAGTGPFPQQWPPELQAELSKAPVSRGSHGAGPGGPRRAQGASAASGRPRGPPSRFVQTPPRRSAPLPACHPQAGRPLGPSHGAPLGACPFRPGASGGVPGARPSLLPSAAATASGPRASFPLLGRPRPLPTAPAGDPFGQRPPGPPATLRPAASPRPGPSWPGEPGGRMLWADAGGSSGCCGVSLSLSEPAGGRGPQNNPKPDPLPQRDWTLPRAPTPMPPLGPLCPSKLYPRSGAPQLPIPASGLPISHPFSGTPPPPVSTPGLAVPHRLFTPPTPAPCPARPDLTSRRPSPGLRAPLAFAFRPAPRNLVVQ